MDPVEVVIHGVLADHQITDVQLLTQGAGNAGVDQMGHTVAVAENLGAEGGIYLAHAAAHHHNAQPFQGSLIKSASGAAGFRFVLHIFQKGFHLQIHGTDDSEFYHSVCSFYSG